MKCPWGVAVGVPAAGQVHLGLLLMQSEGDPQSLLTQQREVGWRLHG